MTGFAAPALLALLWRHRRVLIATTRLELAKKYAGSALGFVWIGLHPILFLSAYIIVFMVIFRLTLPGLTELGYVAYVFSGLIPFITLMEVATTAPVVIRQNLHLIKNVIMPLELVPARVALSALTVQLAALALLAVILLADLSLGWKLLLLPAVMILAAFFLAGLALALAPIGVIVQDLGHGIGIAMNLLMFISPIAFRPDMVPPLVRALVVLNPATYLIEAYRAVLLPDYEPSMIRLTLFVLLSLALFEIGCRVTRRFKHTIVDYE